MTFKLTDTMNIPKVFCVNTDCPIQRFGLIVLVWGLLMTMGPRNTLGVSAADTPAPGETLDFSHVSATDLDSLFFTYNRPDTPGCAVGVCYRGELIFSEGYGVANLDYGIPIGPDSRFMIASISKQFAVAALFMMEQEGLLDLDEDLRTYIPELPVFEKPITARQIIHHTSGLRDLFDLLLLADIGLDNTATAEQVMDIVSRQQRLNFNPGSQHIYNNTGYFLMSVLTHNLTGMTLREYSDKHFFRPMGMSETHWHDDTEMIVPGRVISYRPRPYGPGQFYRGNLDRVGARGLFTTIRDFAKWEANFIENRSNLQDFTEKMTRPGYTHRRDSINYAGGLRLGRYRGLTTVGHGGSYMGFRTHYMRFPAYDFAVIVFCNMSNISPAVYTRQVSDLYLRDVFSAKFKEFAGVYAHEGFDARFEIILDDGDLYLKRLKPDPDATEQELTRLLWQSDDRFRAGSWDLRFHRDNQDKINRLTIEAPRTGPLTFLLQP